MKITVTASRSTGEPGYIVTAWLGDDYRGQSLFMGYTKSEALRIAREQVREEGGLGLYRGIITAR